MTIAEFQDLPLQEQEEALKQGEYISTREYYRQKLDLYSLFDFFVEVWHETETGHPFKAIVITDDEIIKQYAGDILGEVDVFLCGPPLMTKIVCKALRTLNVSDSRIHFERFTLP